MAQSLAADLGERNFNAALVADHSAVLHALVLAAETLPIGYRTEDAGAEKTIALRLEGAVVNGFRFGDLTVRPAPDSLWRCQGNADAVEVSDVVAEIERARTVQSVLRFVVPFPRNDRRTELWHARACRIYFLKLHSRVPAPFAANHAAWKRRAGARRSANLLPPPMPDAP